jgi:hypothetical protein
MNKPRKKKKFCGFLGYDTEEPAAFWRNSTSILFSEKKKKQKQKKTRQRER